MKFCWPSLFKKIVLKTQLPSILEFLGLGFVTIPTLRALARRYDISGHEAYFLKHKLDLLEFFVCVVVQVGGLYFICVKINK